MSAHCSCAENARIIAITDPSAQAGVVVDAATMCQQLVDISCSTAYHISLAPIDISYESFHELFYSTNNAFTPLAAEIVKTKKAKSYLLSKINNIDQDYMIGNSGNNYDTSFNLYEQIKTYYESSLGLNVPMNCWSSCSITNFQALFANQTTLLDTGNGCCICCAMTLDELFESLENQGVVFGINGGPNTSPIDNDNSWVPATTANPGANTKYTIVITALYKSSNKYIEDVAVSWPFLVDFAGVTQRYSPFP